MPDAPPTPPPILRRALAVAVGLFATWQLVFLPASNLIHFVPLRPRVDDPALGASQYQRRGQFTSSEPLQGSADRAGAAMEFWAGASGQEQGWSMFAPGTPPYSVFPATEFHFADGSRDTVLSEFEPADRGRPRARPPLLGTRLFHNEIQLTYPVVFLPPEEVVAEYAPPGAADLRNLYRELPGIVRNGRRLYRAWLAWKAREYAAAHPGRGAPAAVVLKHRYIPMPKPGEPADWSRPAVERPFARWLPAEDVLEAYDVTAGRFVRVEGEP